MGLKSECAIFRRFAALDMLRLMRLQAELIDLETQFWDTCKEDDMSADSESNLFSTDFWILRNAKAQSPPQRELLDCIEEKIRKYGICT